MGYLKHSQKLSCIAQMACSTAASSANSDYSVAVYQPSGADTRLGMEDDATAADGIIWTNIAKIGAHQEDIDKVLGGFEF